MPCPMPSKTVSKGIRRPRNISPCLCDQVSTLDTLPVVIPSDEEETLHKTRKVVVICTDPDATDSSSDEDDDHIGAVSCHRRSEQDHESKIRARISNKRRLVRKLSLHSPLDCLALFKEGLTSTPTTVTSRKRRRSAKPDLSSRNGTEEEISKGRGTFSNCIFNSQQEDVLSRGVMSPFGLTDAGHSICVLSNEAHQSSSMQDSMAISAQGDDSNSMEGSAAMSTSYRVPSDVSLPEHELAVPPWECPDFFANAGQSGFLDVEKEVGCEDLTWSINEEVECWLDLLQNNNLVW